MAQRRRRAENTKQWTAFASSHVPRCKHCRSTPNRATQSPSAAYLRYCGAFSGCHRLFRSSVANLSITYDNPTPRTIPSLIISSFYCSGVPDTDTCGHRLECLGLLPFCNLEHILFCSQTLHSLSRWFFSSLVGCTSIDFMSTHPYHIISYLIFHPDLDS